MAGINPGKSLLQFIAAGGVCTHSGGIIGSDFEKAAIAQTLLGRTGQPGDIASVAAFLASDNLAWLTGEIITASGGLH